MFFGRMRPGLSKQVARLSNAKPILVEVSAISLSPRFVLDGWITTRDGDDVALHIMMHRILSSPPHELSSVEELNIYFYYYSVDTHPDGYSSMLA